MVLQPPTVGQALSGVFGSISLTAWICLLLPQLIANYKAKSADGLSMGFLFIWLLGDITNLMGALWTDLAPTAVALACYFCFADMILIAQCTYYNTLNARRRARGRSAHSRRRRESDSSTLADPDAEVIIDTEDEPLLARQRSSSQGLPGSHRHHSQRRESSGLDPLTRIITGEDDRPDSNPWLHNTVSLAAVYIVGAAGWFVSYRMGAWDVDPVTDTEGTTNLVGLGLGYFSAVCYLCARVPQIIKNYREKSCEGLALLFFLLSLTGNLTYGASLVAYSQKKDYLLKTLPWLLGSLGTIVEDAVIFVQFRLYAGREENKNAPVV
ncbi:hypothetical protein DL546_007378 [Coniochaeta pulveracea]|uniref:Vacuolar membrane PQ loop repeat protein n=1 Tax=Coniochaeta pulveracea TaxID=177199 RepID=A0A420Y8Z9_9PEZI|nr:hypothetical protein DL546_007378 [Coniochaeta pulveracea]